MEDQFDARVEEKKSKWRKVKRVRLGTNGKTGFLLKTASRYLWNEDQNFP